MQTIRGLRSQTAVKSKPKKWISSNIYNGLSQNWNGKKRHGTEAEECEMNLLWWFLVDILPIFFRTVFSLFVSMSDIR